MTLPQLVPHDTRQRTARGLVDVRDLQHGGVELVARAHTADDARSGLLGLLDQLQLARYRVDRVHHVVILREIELCCRFRRVERLIGVHDAVRVDVVHALCGNLHLVPSDRAVRCDQLPVEVGQADRVIVNQVERADPRAHQRLYHMAAHAADAKHRYTCPVQTLHRRLAEQHFRS